MLKLTIKNIILVLMISISMLLVSCKEFSNEKKDENTFLVDIGHIKKQLNVQSDVNGAIVGKDGAKGLIIGAFVVTTRDTPYTKDLKMTEALEDNLKEELANSINYITLANLPIQEDYIPFLIPPATAAKWQVVVVSTNFKLTTLGDLADTNKTDRKLLHKGFTERFYTSGTIGDEVIKVQLDNYNAE